MRFQDHRQRGPKVYALHAPEVECIGKGKARAPYEFGCKVSIATPVTKPKGGQFVLHAKALHGNPFDGHTLGPVIAELEQLTGIETRRIHVDKGYRGHNHNRTFRVWISGQVQRVTRPIRREMKRRAAVEPVIGHVKAEHRMGRNYLKGRDGDRINAVLAAAGYNFGLLLRWLASLLRAYFLAAIRSASAPAHARIRPAEGSSPTTVYHEWFVRLVRLCRLAGCFRLHAADFFNGLLSLRWLPQPLEALHGFAEQAPSPVRHDLQLLSCVSQSRMCSAAVLGWRQ